MMKGIVLLVMAFVLIVGCSTVRKFDPAKGVFSNDTEKIPCWDVDEREDEVIGALKTHGKLKIIQVRESNPWAKRALGGMMVIGAIAIIFGIGTIWATKGVKLKTGLMLIGGGISTYVTAYMVDRWLLQLCIGFGVLLVAGIAYVFIVKRNIITGLVRGFEASKDEHWSDEAADKVREAQGSAQQTIKAIKNKVK